MVDPGVSASTDAALSTEQAPHEVTEGTPDLTARPTTPLRLVQLFQISVYWLALNAIWGGWELFQQKRVPQSWSGTRRPRSPWARWRSWPCRSPR